MKDENGLHFLGWAILANVSEGQIFQIACATVAIGYACLSVYQKIRSEK